MSFYPTRIVNLSLLTYPNYPDYFITSKKKGIKKNILKK